MIGVVGFGIYALYTIVKNVINLKNYPDEAESLLKVAVRDSRDA